MPSNHSNESVERKLMVQSLSTVMQQAGIDRTSAPKLSKLEWELIYSTAGFKSFPPFGVVMDAIAELK